ncbi:hypothetical protein O5275_14875 [Escherichia coli]|nr:hypothetical protein [Escherichia coli]
MAETTAVCRCRKAEKKFQKAIKENPHNLLIELGGTLEDYGGLTEYGISIYETVSEIQPFAVY